MCMHLRSQTALYAQHAYASGCRAGRFLLCGSLIMCTLSFGSCAVFSSTLAMLNIEPPEPKTSGSNAADCINLLGILHIVDLIC
jgi:hypothetical protein